MTGYTVHTGSSKKFSEGWDQIFKDSKTASPKAATKSVSKKSTTAKPTAVKKSSRKSPG